MSPVHCTGVSRLSQKVILGAQSGALHSLMLSFAAGGCTPHSTLAALEYVSSFAAVLDTDFYQAVRRERV